MLAVALLVRVGLETRRKIERAARIDLLLLLYILGYLLINWLIAFNIYPRYLLPLLIPAALLAARTVIWLWAWLRPRLSEQEGIVLAAALVLTLAYGARIIQRNPRQPSAKTAAITAASSRWRIRSTRRRSARWSMITGSAGN